MSEMLILLYIGIVAIFVIVFILFLISWSTHIEMNREEGSPYDWCNFKRFMDEFNKYKNHPKLKADEWGGSSILLFEEDGENYYYTVYLHAGIIRFDNKCMILYPCSYLIYCIWKYNFNKKIRYNRQKGLWR